MMELRRRNLHNADIGKKIEINGRKVMSDLQGSLGGYQKTPRRLFMSCAPPPSPQINNNERCGFQQLE